MGRVRIGLLAFGIVFATGGIYAKTAQRVLWREPYSLELGAKSEHTFLVDASKALQVTVRQKNGELLGAHLADPVDVSLITPSGEVIPYKDTLVDFENLVQAPESSGALKHSVVEQPAPGEWHVQLVGRSSQESAVKYVVTVELIDPIYNLAVAALPDVQKVGQSMTIEAALTYKDSPVLDATVEALVRTDGFNPEEKAVLILNDRGESGDLQAGDGIYAATFTPDEAGAYSVRYHAAVAQSFARVEETWFNASNQGVVIRGLVDESVVDEDKDGLNESLELKVEVDVIDDTQGYVLAARLYDSLGHSVGVVPAPEDADETTGAVDNVHKAELPQSKGIQVVKFSFSAAEFRVSQSDGPYRLELRSEEAETDDEAETPIEPATALFTTQVHHWQDFEAFDVPEYESASE